MVQVFRDRSSISMVGAKVFNPVVTSHTGHRLEKRRSLGGVVVIEKKLSRIDVWRKKQKVLSKFDRRKE